MKNKLFKYIGYLITLIAFIFIGKSIMSVNLQIKYIKSPISTALLVIFISLCYSLIVFVSSCAWKITLEFINNGKLSYKDIIPIYAKSNIGKYLPGNVMQFAGRNILASKLGFKQLDVTFCSLIEILMLLITDCILSFIFAMKTFRNILSDIPLKIPPVIFILICLLSLAIVIFFILKSKIIKQYRHFFSVNFIKLLLKLFVVYSFTLIIPGIFLFLLLKISLYCKISLSLFFVIISSYTISWVLGYIVPGAPGGIGIRESILILILGPFFSNNIVLLAALLLRISSTAGDLLAFLAAYFIFKT